MMIRLDMKKPLYDIKREAAKYQPDYFTKLVVISYWR